MAPPAATSASMGAPQQAPPKAPADARSVATGAHQVPAATRMATDPPPWLPAGTDLVSQINEDAGPSSSLVRSIKGSKEPKHASGEQKEKSKKSAPRKGKGKAAKEKIASRVVAIGEQTPKGKEKCSEVAPHDSPAMGTRSKRASHSPAMSTRSKRAPVRLDL
ncbi:uncharacterized protein [Triticum aestivum]|uniref:uncharacterized protein n=1 Tax=Triticum aestivum TaxID=4565 RepID=UPI001D011664|nr:uncharacterized protein LOC123100936 [Triticum aestivum]